MSNKYTIQFIGLKLGKHSFTYHIDNKFFDYFKYDDFNLINCQVDLLLIKKTTLIELVFTVNGTANLNCDITNETYDESINNELHILVKFGEVYNDDNEDLLILPHASYELDVSQYIYESIVLSLPVKRIHPGIKDGSLQSDVLEKLKEYQIQKNNETDPRWDKLNKLLTSKNS